MDSNASFFKQANRQRSSYGKRALNNLKIGRLGKRTSRGWNHFKIRCRTCLFDQTNKQGDSLG